MLSTINAALGDKALATEILQKIFNQWWPCFERDFNVALKSHTPPQAPKRTDREILAEVLEICRAIQRNQSPAWKGLEDYISSASGITATGGPVDILTVPAGISGFPAGVSSLPSKKKNKPK